jgi:inhibitor of KinA
MLALDAVARKRDCRAAQMKWFPYGPNAWLLEFAENVGEEAFFRARSILAELERRPPSGLIEYVPAFTTVLLEFEPQQSDVESKVLPELLERLNFGALAKLHANAVKTVPVCYDGPDLGRVAEQHGLTMAEVAEVHAAPIYKVYLLGFSPGFPYLGELDPRLHTPRLATPRPRVAAGSIGIGGAHTGIYTLETPGGWNIIGHTPLQVFDAARGALPGSSEDMFLLKAGDRVKFRPMPPSHGT